MIDQYRLTFAKLHSDKSPSRWSAETNYRAPHKPFLLLSIMDLIAQGQILRNFIELNAELMEAFDLYWSKLMDKGKDSNALLPFYHLKSEGFWHLIPVPGNEQVLQAVTQIRTFRQMSQLVLGAQLDEGLFELLRSKEARDSLRRVLIEQYFAPKVQQKLFEVGQIATEAFEYSHKLLEGSQRHFRLREAPEVDEQYHTEARSTAFRRVVVHAYNHTCAVCGIRVVTPEGRTAVAAAHIIPWSISHNDDPRNGMALCGLHHWTFDQGMIGVAQDYYIVVSRVIPDDQEGADPLLALSRREIRRPANHILWPAKRALKWHFENVFRADVPERLL